MISKHCRWVSFILNYRLSIVVVVDRVHSTEVGRAFLIYFPKSFCQKVVIRIKIARVLKIYV